MASGSLGFEFVRTRQASYAKSRTEVNRNVEVRIKNAQVKRAASFLTFAFLIFTFAFTHGVLFLI
jgi:hypothetical protein